MKSLFLTLKMEDIYVRNESTETDKYLYERT
jgi:hypothetical protein